MVSFSIKDKRLTPIIIEFSGSIKFNSTKVKEEGDEEKMIQNMMKYLDYNRIV